MAKELIKKVKEVYREYDRYIVYNVYKINEDKTKTFLYCETISKIEAKVDVNKGEENEDIKETEKVEL